MLVVEAEVLIRFFGQSRMYKQQMLVRVALFFVSLQLLVGVARRAIVSSTFDELLHEPLGYAFVAQYV
jgi:hypothetical protein